VHLRNEVGDVFFVLQVLRLVVFVEIVGGDAQNLQPLRGVLIVEFLEPGNLNLAGSAPGGPEVDDNGLALEAGERNLLALKVFERKVASAPCAAGGALPAGCAAALSGTSVNCGPCSFACSRLRR
jgi:hypothetical protein